MPTFLDGGGGGGGGGGDIRFDFCIGPSGLKCKN